MFREIIKYRPTNLHAVYVESGRIEVLRAHRKWRSWEIESAEQFQIPDGESVINFLQNLNLRPMTKKGSALLLLLPNTFYSVHKEQYPLSLKEHLEEAITFDWQENIFHELDKSVHFFGPPIPLDQSISVPIFSMQREIYDKFYQALNGSFFHTFTVAPTALSYASLLPGLAVPEDNEPLEIIGRLVGDSQIEIHRFYRGSYLDSVVIGNSCSSLKMFRQNLLCQGNGDDSSAAPHIHLLCLRDEYQEAQDFSRNWAEQHLPIKVHTLNESFVANWVRYLLKQEPVYTFDAELLLKPWQVPQVVWPLVAAIALFALFSFYQVHSTERLVLANKQVKTQLNQLENHWKPIEELQSRISKFQEDKKTLAEFNKEAYPLMELLSVLTQVTPDDTWLNYLSLRKGQLIMRGESKSAIKYLSELSKTDGLTDVKFASPVTRNPASDQERFNVQLQLDVDKLQKSIATLPADSLADTATPGSDSSTAKSAQGIFRAPAGEADAGESPVVPQQSTPEEGQQ
jgi:general secretion pathway protein L